MFYVLFAANARWYVQQQLAIYGVETYFFVSQGGKHFLFHLDSSLGVCFSFDYNLCEISSSWCGKEKELWHFSALEFNENVIFLRLMFANIIYRFSHFTICGCYFLTFFLYHHCRVIDFFPSFKIDEVDSFYDKKFTRENVRKIH